MAPPPAPPVDLHAAPAYRWGASGLTAVPRIVAPDTDMLCGIDRQRDAVLSNMRRHATGAAAHDVLLWGARGTGKSALVRAAVRDAGAHGDIALVQASADSLDSLPHLFALLNDAGLHDAGRRFVVFIDDLGFAPGEERAVRQLRSLLEGGVAPRPANVRIAVTSNRRAIVPRHGGEQDDPINPRDAVDDALALADRFGLVLGFHAVSQDDYLAIVAAYANAHALQYEEADALAWAQRRGARSGRVARQFVTELAGRAGLDLA
nr:ATP-binding protein [Croceicoccus hydrothermalis]